MIRCQWQDKIQTVWIMRTFETNPDYIKFDLSCSYVGWAKYESCNDLNILFTIQLVTSQLSAA